MGDRVMDSERRVEEDLAQDSQDLSSAASLDRDSGSSNEESGLARRRTQRRRPRKQEPEANGRPIVVENSGPGSRLYSTISSKEGTPSDAVPAAAKVGPAAAVTVVPAAAGGNASSTGPSQPREQRNRVDKTSAGRKQTSEAAKGHEETVANGTAA